MNFSLLNPKKQIFFFREIDVPALAPGQLINYDTEIALKTCRKFLPFSNMQVVNSSLCKIEMILDYNPLRKLIILGGGTKALRNQPFNCFSLKNKDATITTEATDIVIELETIR
jgi:hypothetical protein